MNILNNLLVLGVVAVWSISSAAAAQPVQVLPKAHAALDCATCHGSPAPSGIPDNAACLKCHGGMDALVKATSKYVLNPHQSPHWGDSVPCGTCHKQHSQPKVYCAACHTNQGYAAK